MVCRSFLNFLLYVPAGDMELILLLDLCWWYYGWFSMRWRLPMPRILLRWRGKWMNDGQQKFPELSSMSRRRTYNNLQSVVTSATLLRSRQNLVQLVSMHIGFNLHYFSSPSDHFLPKELSQIFAPIPGGGHATSRAELFMLRMVQMSRSTPALSRATAR